MKFKLAYCGTPDFSARLLEKLLINKNLAVEILFVITQKDKPVGRDKILTSSPVKLTAKKYHIPVYYHMNDIPLSLFSTIDLCIVYSYGQIIPAQFLNVPRLGFWNIHPSLLPKYRGPSPIAYPLFLGDTDTGVTLMKMDEKIDHGDIIAQEKVPIAHSDKRADLEIKLTDIGYELMKKTIVQLTSTKLTHFHLKRQSHDSATSTRLLTRNHGFVALEMIKKALISGKITDNHFPSLLNTYLTKYPREKVQFYKRTFDFGLLIFNLYRALSPWPGIWTKVIVNKQEKRLKLTDLSFEQNKLNINRVQLEGKKEVGFIQFNTSYKIFEIKP